MEKYGLTMTSSISNRSHTKRIMNDVLEFYRESPVGIYIVPEENNICNLHALIIGLKDTPYENGFFYFVLKFPDTYPLHPPHVRLMTTYQNTVRFNPNLYKCGRVCLSILGTFSVVSLGPSWSSALTISSTLLSIQTLMTEHPYYNEPGYEKMRNNGANKNKVSDYDAYITHEKFRVAVIEMLQENSTDTWGMPAALKGQMISHFKLNYQLYENLMRIHQNLDGEPIVDPLFKDRNITKSFGYKQMLEKIVKLRQKFCQTNDDTSIPIYDEIVKRILSSSDRDVYRPVDDSTEDLNEYMLEPEESVDGSTLYESESDGDN